MSVCLVTFAAFEMVLIHHNWISLPCEISWMLYNCCRTVSKLVQLNKRSNFNVCVCFPFQIPFWMTFCWPTQCSCQPVICVKLCSDNILPCTSEHYVIVSHNGCYTQKYVLLRKYETEAAWLCLTAFTQQFVLLPVLHACLSQHQDPPSVSVLKALTKPHLLHQAIQGERGQEGGSGEESEGLAPGVTVGRPLQRLPERGRARQVVHEGRRGWQPGARETSRERGEAALKWELMFPPQTLYHYVLDDLYEYPALERDARELQRVYPMHRRQWVTIS